MLAAIGDVAVGWCLPAYGYTAVRGAAGQPATYDIGNIPGVKVFFAFAVYLPGCGYLGLVGPANFILRKWTA